MKKGWIFGCFLLIIAALVGTSCSDFRKLQKSQDWRAKYDGAMRFYEQEEYYHAAVLLEEILPIIRGMAEAEKASFYRGYAYFHQGQYILSANYFKEFATIYSRSEWAIEAEYLFGYSLYRQSPIYNLDQTSTYDAITALQVFIHKYPYDDYAEKATVLIDEMQVKLETKSYENAKHYYKLRRWEAARISFETFTKEFPDSKLIEEILYLAVDSEYSYARQSIQSRQKERYSKTVELYENFIDKYPNSKFLKEAEYIYADSVDEIRKLSRKS